MGGGGVLQTAVSARDQIFGLEGGMGMPAEDLLSPLSLWLPWWPKPIMWR